VIASWPVNPTSPSIYSGSHGDSANDRGSCGHLLVLASGAWELDDPEGMGTLDGGGDDPDGIGGPTPSAEARSGDAEGWDLDTEGDPFVAEDLNQVESLDD